MEISVLKKIKELIAEGDVDTAIKKLLIANERGEYGNNIILQASRYNGLQKDQANGLLSPEFYQMSLNRIANALISVLDQIGSDNKSRDNQKPEADNSYFSFTKISLENIRCFGKKQTIHFLGKNKQPAKWNVIIGDNGTGKTTLLRSLALVLLFYKKSSPWKKMVFTEYFSRNERETPKVGYEVLGNETTTEKKKYQFDISILEGEFSPGGPSNFLSIPDWVERLNVHAYGASRKIGTSGFTTESEFPASNLFDENALLTNAEEWLVKTEYLALKGGKAKKTLKKVTELLIKLLGKEVTDMEIRTQGETPVAMFKTGYGWVELHNLSLGYKTLIAWMVDFAKGMFERYPQSVNPLAEPAILLIDEIDLHLHPKLQQTLMKFLTDTFPKTQFIATAHSPLVIQSAENSNIILLKKEGDHVVVEQNPYEIKNWRIDQLLTSDLYGLPSARPPQTEEKIERRRSLLRKDKRTKKEESELEKLEEELVELPVGETPEAIKAMEIIQKAAKHYGRQQNGKN